MPKKTEVLLAIGRLNEAIARLQDAVERAQDDLDRDGVIQRFEFSVELLWKTLKIVLEYQGVICASPRACVKEAFRHGLIGDDEVLLDMLEDRNRSSHVYNEAMAEEIFARIRDVYTRILGRIPREIERAI